MKRYQPKDGFVFNPMMKYPRNDVCFCGKTILKAKKCCLPNLKATVTLADANKLEAYLKQVRAQK